MIRINCFKKTLTDVLIKERLLKYDIDGFITINRKFKTNGGDIEFEKEYQLPFVKISSKEHLEIFKPKPKFSVEEKFHHNTKRYVLWDYNKIIYKYNLYLSDIKVYFGIYKDYLVYYIDIDTRYFDSYSHTKNDLCLSLERLKTMNKKMKIAT